jgi:hypothetical protein
MADCEGVTEWLKPDNQMDKKDEQYPSKSKGNC